MIVNSVCVLGGSGFVGRHVCEALVERGYRVTVPTRNRERAKHLMLLPTVDVVNADIHNPVSLTRVLRGHQAVINLVGVLHDGRGAASFREAHVDLARKVVGACKEAGTERLVHMSALNADEKGPSEYLRTKGEAESIVRASGLAYTIFRPSVIFGPEDRFLNTFAKLQRTFPVLPLGNPNARFQPVYVRDLAAAVAASLTDLTSYGRSFDICGPRAYTLRELVRYVGELTGHRRAIVGLGPRMSYLQAFALELSPVKVVTRDNHDSMKVDSVSSQALPFGITPTPLEAVAPSWLALRTPRARYQALRASATGPASRTEARR